MKQFARNARAIERAITDEEFAKHVIDAIQRAILAVDELKGRLDECRRPHATTTQASILLAIAMAYVEAVTPPDDRRQQVLEFADRLRPRIKFTDLSKEKAEQTHIIVPGQRIVL